MYVLLENSGALFMQYMNAGNMKMIASSGSIREIDVQAYGEGFILRAKMGMDKEVVLKPANSKGARVFKTIDAAARFVRRDLELSNMKVLMANWTPKQRKLELG